MKGREETNNKKECANSELEEKSNSYYNKMIRDKRACAHKKESYILLYILMENYKFDVLLGAQHRDLSLFRMKRARTWILTHFTHIHLHMTHGRTTYTHIHALQTFFFSSTLNND
ncbi:hypothetical protein PUN28_010658 [Cardiocondyla obscurior]|uniref:Uncharacterized protein n=1 Tax=Cardiocondyla obscurior TaxID=286306 RepID=A0AAW2FID4_9HYME